MNYDEMTWQDIVEAMGWDLESEYRLAMDFIFEELKAGEAYEAYLAKRAKEESGAATLSAKEEPSEETCNEKEPWIGEPNQAHETAHGFSVEVLRNGLGALCGYVLLPVGHPWHGKGFGEIKASVHGGVTYARWQKDSTWKIGFDCAHWGDRVPLMNEGGTYRTMAYVLDECRSLARQAAEAAREGAVDE